MSAWVGITWSRSVIEEFVAITKKLKKNKEIIVQLLDWIFAVCEYEKTEKAVSKWIQKT